MIAEILAIGNEVVDGSVVNTNASWLSQQLGEWGVEVRFHSVVPDDETLMLQALETARGRAQWVLVTGGLGPTVDDFTLEVAARFFDLPLDPDSQSLAEIRKTFKRLGRKITPNQERQAWVPRGSTVLPNKKGTAVGVYYQFQGVHFSFFPGVPSELKAMFLNSMIPLLKPQLLKQKVRRVRVLRCFGLPEGQFDHELREKIEGRLKLLGAQIGFRVRVPSIDIRLQVKDVGPDEADKILDDASRVLYQKLGKYIFGEGSMTLAQGVGQLLKEGKQTLASAESCTGGLLANQITDVPGASDYFLEGVVSYSNRAKMDLLGVGKETLERFGAVSSEVALEMAKGIRDRAGSDFGVGITGIAGPSGGSPEKPVGTVHIAIFHPLGEWEREYHFPFERVRFKEFAVATALDRIRRLLKKN